MRSRTLVPALVAAMLAAAACNQSGGAPSVAVPSVAVPSIPAVSLPAGANTKVVQLAPLNNSGVQGAATLTDLGNGSTQVVVAVNPNNNNNMPTHIHEGTCANLTPAPKYPLSNVQGGASTTTVNVALADLTRAPFAINLHKSPQEAAVYTACGDIK